MNILHYIKQEEGVRRTDPHVRGVLCSIIFDRYEAGESMESLAHDYGLGYGECREAIVFEAGRRYTWRKCLPMRKRT